MQFSNTNLFRPSLSSITLTLSLGLLLWLKELFITPLPFLSSNNLVQDGFPSIVISFLLVILTGYIFQRIVDKYNFLQNRSILPFLLFILFSATQNDFWQVTTGKINLFLFSLVILEILSTFHENEPVKKVFIAGLLLSLCILLNVYFLILIPFLFISIYIINKITLRSLHAIVLGLLTPPMFVLGYAYISGNIQFLYSLSDFKMIQLNNILFDENLIYTFIIILLGIISIRGILYHQYQNNLQQRKNSYVVIWAFVFFVIISFLSINRDIQMTSMLSGITSLLTALYFAKNSTFKNTIFLFILILSIIVFNFLISYGTFS
jgi:hypothetical protein